MSKLVECVPNFSEGRDRAVIDAIVGAVKAVPGVSVLDCDPGASTNRTVLTFVGSPEAVVEGALACARKCYELIDMTKQHGEHPRNGALDVCPFVPVANVTMQDCVELAKEFGRRVAEELDVPVFLYEEAQTKEYRKALKDIRKGEYEALQDKLENHADLWTPDFGPCKFVPRFGSVQAGARFFLIAYNINVLGTKEQAHKIALNLRESGRGPDKPGRLPKTKAIGWFVEEYGYAQISMNLDNYRVTPIHKAYEEAKADSEKMGVAITGSELVGLVPLEAIMMAADYYIEKEHLLIVEERLKVKLAIERLGLSACSTFDPNKRIIEYVVRGKPEEVEPLASLSVRKFIESCGARTATPGGGSVSALVGAVGAALATMVGWLSYGKVRFEPVEPHMRNCIPKMYKLMQELIPLVDADSFAYESVMRAVRLPGDTLEEKAEKDKAIEAETLKAAQLPMETINRANSAWDVLLELAEFSSIKATSDLEIAARSLELAVWGAQRNVAINVASLNDKSVASKLLSDSVEACELAKKKCEEVLEKIRSRMPPESQSISLYVTVSTH